MLKIENISKKFGKNDVLKDVSLTLDTGVYGLLGPNGAGKTTLMRILSTIIPSDSGNVMYNGVEWNKVNTVRKYIGYLPQKFSLYKNLTVVEALEHIAMLKGLSKKSLSSEVSDVIHKVNLDQDKNKKIKELSGGMVRRVGIAQAILGKPPIIIVDEPTAGLDPEERTRFRNLIKTIGRESTVLISTHIVDDVKTICQNAAILNHGKIIASGPIDHICSQAQGKVWEIIVSEDEYIDIGEKYSIVNQEKNGSDYNLVIISDHKPTQDAKECFPTLEAAFLYLINKDNNYDKNFEV